MCGPSKSTKVSELVQGIRPAALWTDASYMKRRGMDLVEISKMLLDYKACDTIIEGEPTPEQLVAT